MKVTKAQIWTGIILALLFGVALYLRAYLPYNKIFTAEGIKFAGNDAYYFMRQVDILAHHFPNVTTIEPYYIYPGGVGGPVVFRFFAWLLAGIVWVIGLGSPTEHMIDVVSAYYPAVLGALTVIPVYFIGKELLNRWAGLLAAGLVILLPGEFLGRSILGFTDQHVAEVLFTTVSMMFLILAVKTARQRQLTLAHIKRRDWAIMVKPAIYSVLAGIFLGIYILTWEGALLFVFIIAVYFTVQCIIDHFNGKSTDYLSFVAIITCLVTLIISSPIFSSLSSASLLTQVAIVITLLIPLVLNGVSRLMTMRKIKLAYYPVVLVGLGLIGVAALYVINPDLVRSALYSFGVVFFPQGAQLTTLEMQPILFPNGNFSLAVLQGNFPGLLPLDSASSALTFGNTLSLIMTTFFISVVSIAILAYKAVKQGDSEKIIVVVWSLVILAATLSQRRFAYYLAVNVGLLTGYLSWQVLDLVVLKRLSSGTATITRRAGSSAARLRRGGASTAVTSVVVALAMLVIFSVVFFPNIKPAIDTASSAPFAPSDAWMRSMFWMKENTPEPFGSPDSYYQIHELPPPGETYKYPESFYGVMAWWDYGYYITRIAHRVPNANPSQSPVALPKVAAFFTSQDESSANKITQELNSKYIVIDYQTDMGMFYAMATWAGKKQTEFFDVYYIPPQNQQQNQLQPVQLFYPEYYRSLASRLYNFDGKAVNPASITVISYQDKADPQGTSYKLITSAQQFTSYADATAHIASQNSTNYKIIGTNPLVSAVPLEALEHYKLVYSSANSITMPDVGAVPEVKIFEYSN